MQIEYKKVALCGYRNKGRKILNLLQAQEIKVLYIIERNYEALSQLEQSLNIPIVGFDTPNIYTDVDAIVMSGDLQENLVYECLKMANSNKPIIKFDGEKDV